MATGQTISDRLLAARHSLAGQGLAKAVCKATTEESIPPKKKHLDYLIHCTNEPNVSILQLANFLLERSQNTNWVVVLKSLVTTHHLMCYGNERFTQYLASSNCTFQLTSFLDKANPQGYEVSPFVRRYARYINEKALSYRTMAFDFCKVKRGKEDGTLRTMGTDPLLKTFPVLQTQMDSLLEVDPSADDIHRNSLMRVAFSLLFRDLIRLFATYNDAVINLLEKYFTMNKKNARDALDYYKKFLTRMDKVSDFLKVAEAVGIDKGEIPDLTKAPSSLLEALEQHLATLEGRKLNSTSKQNSVDVSSFSSTQTAFIASDEKQKILAEEEAALNQFKEQKSDPGASATNPFLQSSAPPQQTSQNQQILDLFAGSPATASKQSALDDLLSLGLGSSTNGTATNGSNAFGPPTTGSSNPFADFAPQQKVNYGGNGFAPMGGMGMGNQQQQFYQQPPPTIQQPFGAFGSNNDQASEGAPPPPPPSTPQNFTKQPQQQQSVDFFGSILTPQQSGAGFGGQTQPAGASAAAKPLFTGDLDSSLASLADSLTMKSNWSPSPSKTAKGTTANTTGRLF